MPHPGLKVATDENFQGRLSGMYVEKCCKIKAGTQKEKGSTITICVSSSELH